MSLLNRSQKIKKTNSEMYVKHRNHDDDILLSEQLDEGELEKYWDQVVSDIHHDPEWFSFADR